MIGQPYVWACERALKGICTGDAISARVRICLACAAFDKYLEDPKNG